MTTRRSKIARLPVKIRNELNVRLEEGQAAQPLLLWLNALPETQKIIAKYFDGLPISESNLTLWRQGGHQDWLAECRATELAERLSRQAQGAQKASRGHLGEQLSVVLTLRVAALMQKLLASDDDKSSLAQQWQYTKELVREADRVRRSDLRAQHLKLQQERWEWDQERQEAQDQKAATEARKQFEIDRLTEAADIGLKIHLLTLRYQNVAKARFVAETTNAIKFDLPQPAYPKTWDEEEKDQKNEGGKAERHKAEPGEPEAQTKANGAPKDKGTKAKKPERNGHNKKRPQTKKTRRTKAKTHKAERLKRNLEKQAKNGPPSREPQPDESSAADLDLTAPGAETAETGAQEPGGAGPEQNEMQNPEPGTPNEEAGGQEPDGAGPPV